MKKYRYSFPKAAVFIYALIVLASVTAIVFASLRLAGVGAFVSIYPAVDITSIVVFVVFVALLGWNLLTSYYAFTEDAFVVSQLFSKKKIARDAVCKFVLDEASGVAALYYFNSSAPDVLCYVTVNLRKSVMQSFIEDLRGFRPDVAVETISAGKDKE